MKFRKVNIVIPKINPSNFSIQLRRDNERLIRKLERIERGPFGLGKWFRIK